MTHHLDERRHPGDGGGGVGVRLRSIEEVQHRANPVDVDVNPPARRHARRGFRIERAADERHRILRHRLGKGREVRGADLGQPDRGIERRFEIVGYIEVVGDLIREHAEEAGATFGLLGLQVSKLGNPLRRHDATDEFQNVWRSVTGSLVQTLPSFAPSTALQRFRNPVRVELCDGAAIHVEPPGLLDL